MSSTRELVNIDWTFSRQANGAYSCDAIQAAGVVEIARLSLRILTRLDSIQGLMMQLGTDGIHDVIREAARVARQRHKSRLARRRTRRKKAKAAR